MEQKFQGFHRNRRRLRLESDLKIEKIRAISEEKQLKASESHVII